MNSLRFLRQFGMWLLVLTPAAARSGNDVEASCNPFLNTSFTSFADVWREPAFDVVHHVTDDDGDHLEQATSVSSAPLDAFTSEGSLSVSGSPQRLTTSPQAVSMPPSQARLPLNSVEASGAGLVRWSLGLLGVVGCLALGGVYLLFRLRPELDMRNTTGRLKLNATLALPRRAGLYLIDVNDQPVLLAIDGSGLRQIVSLGTRSRAKVTRRWAKDQEMPSEWSTNPTVTSPLWTEAFQDVLQSQQDSRIQV